MRPIVYGYPPSAWPPVQSPAQAFMSSPATESPGQIGHGMEPHSPSCDQQSNFYDVVKALETFLSAGLDHKQISDLCKPKNFNQLATIANADESVLQSAWDFVDQKRPGSKSRKLSRGPAMRYPSGVSSLRSNRSQWSASTELSTSTADSFTSGFGNPAGGQPQASIWPSVSGEMDAMVSGDLTTQGNHAPMNFVAPNFEQPQRQDWANVNTTGITSAYQPHALVDVSSLSRVGNTSLSYGAPASASYYTAGGKTTHDSGQSAGSTDKAHRQTGGRSARKDQIKYPCSEPGCRKGFLRSVELAKHLQGDHEKNENYVCQHDQNCKMQTYRHATWARHHSKDHNSCKKGDACVKINYDRKKRYWGCSICMHLSKDVSSHADHHQSHFKDGAAQPHDIKYSSMILSLLSQEATKGKWEELCLAVRVQVGNCDFAWQPSRCEEIRLALEYGKYQGFDISDPSVADWLVNDVFALMSGKRKRDASGIPVPDFGNLPDPEGSWLDVDPTSFLDTTDVEFNKSY
ncbi:uncharacterized protein Z520_09857 [Fonsecaea multimorphosa CBS 102226]|uniref:C2H2-type domain-containing protein n=1 Tax=Fonsecaea multimorphosa CBS 102226 TaxID=1442371 RepID=A0A0D2IBF4_9EURO|nr:uncharacterized protein Z520_09857 [Fonsecaea multimorphosa CBS 102226]KIX94471.1 hypothetical protein Z520_09857 [Fonsecaea multimorphosa CBS 102226]OAL20050.1 hypothetical protein AYO22_09200 [Fonsecaea multimorphosa]